MHYAYSPPLPAAPEMLLAGPPQMPVVMLALIALGFALASASWWLPPVSYRRNGGLRFVKVGRFGASFYVSRKPARG